MKKTLTKPRTIISLCFGLFVFGFLLREHWVFMSSDRVQYKRNKVRFGIEVLNEEVRAYRDEHGVLPRSPAQLGDLKDRIKREANGTILDGWQHPYVYEVESKNFRIISYGRDGKPGGVGLDCDLMSDNLYPAEARMPFSEFLATSIMPKRLIVSLLAGIFVAAISWFTFSGFSYWFA